MPDPSAPDAPGGTLDDYARSFGELPDEVVTRAHVRDVDNLVRDIRAELPGVIEMELAMHEATCHSEEVRQRVIGQFGR